ncbi:MAG: adenylate/guanylate cyclase domain-containing protein [Nostocaceae cyanobacterium]|nr:adenylate/guanylate cyclase domain-containing protein [Nostocaceae cyanobacterium]
MRNQMWWWEKTPNFLDSYEEQRQRFMINRLRLITRISLMICVTVALLFLLFPGVPVKAKIDVIITVGSIAICTIIAGVLCQNNLTSRYPSRIFLGLSWAAIFIEQITSLVLFGDIEPSTDVWTLIFITQATIIPVLWHLHLISQLGTVGFYLILYRLANHTLENNAFYYAHEGLYLVWICIICNFSVYLYERLQKIEFYARQELRIAQEKTERLLLNILPESIAERLKQQNAIIADSFEEVSVLFADIVGFTELSTQMSPSKLVDLLNKIFSRFDKLAEYHKVEKIKTIGDAYMVVSGLPDERKDHAKAIANMALDMQKSLDEFNRENNQSFRIRIGISTGPAVAGVIGLKKFAYDLWGDTVNTASRMESHGIPGCIQVCEDSYQRLKDKYILEPRGLIKVKGKGEMMTYLLRGLIVNN